MYSNYTKKNVAESDNLSLINETYFYNYGTREKNTDNRASSIADISKTLGNIIEGSKPDFTAIMLDIKNDNSKALYEHLSNGLDVNTILPAVPRKSYKQDVKPLTLLECAVSYASFNCVVMLLQDAKLDLNLRANRDYPSPTARAFINFEEGSFSIAKMLYEKDPNSLGCAGDSLLNYVFFTRTFDRKNISAKLLEAVKYLLAKGCRLQTNKEIWKIYEKFEMLSKKTDFIDSLIAIIDAHR